MKRLGKLARLGYTFIGVPIIAYLLIFQTSFTSSLVNAVPVEVHTILVLALIFWTAGATFNALPRQPLTLIIGGIIGMIGLVYFVHLSPIAWIPSVATIVIAGIVGFVAWFVSYVIFSGIVMSMCGISPSKMRYEQTDDPYGDPHAQRILNGDE